MENRCKNKKLSLIFKEVNLTKCFVLTLDEIKNFEQMFVEHNVYMHKICFDQQFAYQITVQTRKDSKTTLFVSIYRSFNLATCKQTFDSIVKIINPILNEIKFRNLSKLIEFCENILNLIDLINLDGWTLNHVCVKLNLNQLFTNCLRSINKNFDSEFESNLNENLDKDLKINSNVKNKFNLNQNKFDFKIESNLKIKSNKKSTNFLPKKSIFNLKKDASECSLQKENSIYYEKIVLNEINKQTNNLKLTPLHLAIKCKNLNLVKQLVRFNIDYLLVDSNGNNVFHYAAYSKTSKEFLTILIRNCSPTKLVQALSARNQRSCTPLHVACFTKKIANIKELMQVKLPLENYIISTNQDQDFFKQYIESNTFNEQKFILFTPKQINSFSDQELFLGGTPLHWCNDSNVLAQLLQIGFIKYINIRNINQETALHTAVRLGRFRCAIVLFCCGEQLDLTGDSFGNTPLHLAVQNFNFKFVQLLVVFGNKKLLNATNKYGHTARHLAATQSTEHQDKILYALHVVGALRCGHQLLLQNYENNLHLVKFDAKDCKDGCCKTGSFNGNKFYQIIDDTLEYWYTDYNLKCLKQQISDNCKGKLINSSNLEVNITNKEEQTKKIRKSINLIKSYLHILSGSSNQAKSKNNNLTKINSVANIDKNYSKTQHELNNLQSKSFCQGADNLKKQTHLNEDKLNLKKNAQQSNENNLYSLSNFLSIKTNEKETPSLTNLFKRKKIRNNKSNVKKNRVLCIDGGGIKGLFIIQILIELESRLKHPLKSYFNWFCGTSTGSFIATMLCLDYKLSDIRTLYFLIKNKIFKRTPCPYDAKILEFYLEKYLGNRTMSSVRNCKLTITSTLFDRSPIQLHLFRNYPSPNELLNLPMPKVRSSNQSKEFKTIPTFKKQKLWEACRASSAAPYYFKPYGSFCDGGILSNCPTMDIITEHFLYNDIRRVINQSFLKEEQLELIVSLGCGEVRINNTSGYDCDFTTFANLSAKLKKWLLYARQLSICRSFIEMLISEVTNTEHHKHRRTLAWCRSINVPYFRISPTMTNKLKIDERQDESLINGLWEAKAYMFERKEMIDELVNFLELYYEENIYEENNSKNQVINLTEEISEQPSSNESSYATKKNIFESDEATNTDEEANFKIADILSDFTFF